MIFIYIQKCILFFLDNTKPPTIETIDQYMLNLEKLLSTTTDPYLIASVKKAVSNLDFSQF